MTRKFIAAVAVAAIAVAAFGSAPARADQDLIRALAAIAGIAIVGKVISDKIEDDRDEAREVTRYRDDGWTTHDRSDRRWSDDVIRRHEPRPLPQQVQRRLLPGDCLRSYPTRDGRVRVFGRKCLHKNYHYNKSLPRACEVKFRSHGKTRHGYDARCLRRDGYQLARR